MKNNWRLLGAGAALIVLLTVVVYIPAMRGGFIWEDASYVTENGRLRTMEGLRDIWARLGATPQYYPLVFTTFWVEYHLWGANPFGYHLINILLHALNGLLLWRVLRHLEVAGAWWIAVIFALHPVAVESVAWITERKNMLSGTLYFLTILAYLRFRRLNGDPTVNVWDWRFYPLVVLLFLSALLSKTVTCTLPAVFVLLIWWKKARLEKWDAVALTPLFVLGAALGLMTAWMERHHVGASGAEWDLSFLDRCLIAGRALWFYVGKLVWPHHLAFMYPRWEINAGMWWQYLFPIAVLVVLFTLWLARHRFGKGPLVAALFFAGTLAPALGFVDVFPFRYSFVADHFQYLASVGLIALVVSAAATICERTGQPGKNIGTAVSAAALTVLGVLTWERGFSFRDDEALWRYTLAGNPSSWGAHWFLGLMLQNSGRSSEAVDHYERVLQIKPDRAEAQNAWGNVLLQSGKFEDAIKHYEQALRIQPDAPELHYDIGLALAGLGRAQEAIGHYQQALRIKPNYAEAHNHLGSALLKVGKDREAIEHFEQALRIKPGNADVHYNLGRALILLGKLPEAVVYWEQALRIKPNDAVRQYNLGNVLLKLDRLPDAIAHYEQALRLKPDYAEAHNDLGNALLQVGKDCEAIGHYEQALRIKPDSATAQNNLAWALATVVPAEGGDPARAVTLAQHVCEITSNQVPAYLDTLATAYAAVGRFNDAVATAQKAVELARAAGQSQVVKEIEGRLELYRSGHVYRQPRTPLRSQPVDATSPHNL